MIYRMAQKDYDLISTVFWPYPVESSCARPSILVSAVFNLKCISICLSQDREPDLGRSSADGVQRAVVVPRGDRENGRISGEDRGGF